MAWLNLIHVVCVCVCVCVRVREHVCVCMREQVYIHVYSGQQLRRCLYYGVCPVVNTPQQLSAHKYSHQRFM